MDRGVAPRVVVPLTNQESIRYAHVNGKAPHVTVRVCTLFSKLFDESMQLAQEPERVNKRMEAAILVLKATLSTADIDATPATERVELAKTVMKFNAMVMISSSTLHSAWVPQLSQLEAADALKTILPYDIASQLTLTPKEAKRELLITFESDPPPAPASLERFDSLLGHQSNDLKAQLNVFKMMMLAEFQASHARDMVRLLCLCARVVIHVSLTSLVSNLVIGFGSLHDHH